MTSVTTVVSLTLLRARQGELLASAFLAKRNIKPIPCPISPMRVSQQASRASIIAESAQRNQYLTRFAAWYRVSADFANLSKFSSCS